MKTLFAAIIITSFSFITFVFIKSGAWKSVEVTETTLGPLHLVYKEYVGPYHKIVTAIQDVETWAKSKSIECNRSFGEYLEDPNIVEHERLHSHGGCILSEMPADLPADFKSQTIPVRTYVMASFSGSPALGPLKVYGRIEDYMASKKLQRTAPVLEIYNVKSNNQVETQYLFPISPVSSK